MIDLRTPWTRPPDHPPAPAEDIKHHPPPPTVSPAPVTACHPSPTACHPSRRKPSARTSPHQRATHTRPRRRRPLSTPNTSPRGSTLDTQYITPWFKYITRGSMSAVGPSGADAMHQLSPEPAGRGYVSVSEAAQSSEGPPSAGMWCKSTRQHQPSISVQHREIQPR